MEHLAYPVERRNIALDFDATASTNLPFWKQFIRLANAANYDVYIVTARRENSIAEVRLHFEGLAKEVIGTGHQAKQPFCQDRGLRIDIWIDDSPWNVYCNIDGSTPKYESLSFMHYDFGEAIAEFVFPRNHPLKVRGYGFFYTDMHWEVPLIRQSFHRTKKGAYRAMRKFLEEQWNKHYEQYKTEPRRFGRKETSRKKSGRWYGPFDHSKWAIKPDTIEIME